MARVSLLDKDQVSPEFRERFQKIEESGRPVLNLFKVMAHAPLVGHRFLGLGNAILFKGALPPKLRELAILRVGNLNQADYEWTQHVPIALRVGVRQAQINALAEWEHSPEFNETDVPAAFPPPPADDYAQGDAGDAGEGRRAHTHAGLHARADAGADAEGNG